MCTYLAKRNSTYYFRRAVPPELRVELDGRTEFMFSLRTKNREEAKRLVPAHTEETTQLLDEAAARLRRSAVDLEAVPEQMTIIAPVDLDADLLELQGRAELRRQARREARGRLRAQMEDHATRFSTADLDPYHAILRDIMAERADVAAAFTPVVDLVSGVSAAGSKPVPLLITYDDYAAEVAIKPATRLEWRSIINALIRFLGHHDAARITMDDLDRWRDQLLSETTKRGGKRSARTVKDKYIGAVRATLNWAVEKRRLPENVALRVTVRVPRKAKLRERDFSASEAKAILQAALASTSDAVSPDVAFARRWVPWLCAYTGARVNEISQLRAEDVQQIDGIWAIRITPEAGTVKANIARTVPLHSHVIEQGFLDAVQAIGAGPLFYDPRRQRVQAEGNRHFKKVGERLAQWVRQEVGIVDPGLQPNHAWRHTFKTVAAAADIAERITDAIQGHAPKNVSRTYGSVPLRQKAEALTRFPRFDLTTMHTDGEAKRPTAGTRGPANSR